MNKERLLELRRLSDAASAGPWELSCNKNMPHYDSILAEDERGTFILAEVNINMKKWGDDVIFIAASRTAIPELLDEIESLHVKLETAREALDFYAYKRNWFNKLGIIVEGAYMRFDAISDDSDEYDSKQRTSYAGRRARQALKEIGEA